MSRPSEASTGPVAMLDAATEVVRDAPRSPGAPRRDGTGHSTSKLSGRDRQFVLWYVVLEDGAEAVRRAGFTNSRPKQKAYELLQRAAIKQEIAAARDAAAAEASTLRDAERATRAATEGMIAEAAKLAEQELVTQQWVITKLRENVERAMQAEPVRDKDGVETGEYTYQGAVANGALKLLGEHLGMFTQKVEHTGAGGGPLEVTITRRVVFPVPSDN